MMYRQAVAFVTGIATVHQWLLNFFEPGAVSLCSYTSPLDGTPGPHASPIDGTLCPYASLLDDNRAYAQTSTP